MNMKHGTTSTDLQHSDTRRSTTSVFTTATPLKGTVLPPDVHQDALRHRLGSQFIPEATTCHCCARLLDVKCIRAGCCATVEATRAYYAVARTLLAVANAVDPSTTREETCIAWPSTSESHHKHEGHQATPFKITSTTSSANTGM